MSGIQLTIVSPDGLPYDGGADFIKVRTVTGDVGIKGEHTDYFSVIGFAECAVSCGERVRYAACCDGYLSVKNKTEVRLVCTTFEWAEDIDVKRAEAANVRATELLARTEKSDDDYARYENKQRRAEIRMRVKNKGGER